MRKTPSLSAKKQQLVSRLLAKEGAQFNSFPLSFAQQRLWFLEQLTPGEATYHIPAAVRLQGRLDPAALEWALAEIMRRHEVLRTRVATVDGQPVQAVAASAPVPLTSGETDEAGLAAELAQRATERFDLATGPLWRAHLLRVGPEDHVLLVVLHHLIGDGWSMGVLIRELGALYRARVQGATASPLPPLAVQYADYAVWQRGWLSGSVLEEQLAYWRTQLAGVPVLALPTDHPRPAAVTNRGGRTAFAIPADVVARARALSRREGATLFMPLVAAWQGVVQRWTGQDDIAVGTPIANRSRPELEALIGMFVNTLVLRQDVSGNPTFRALLQRVRTTTLEAYAHQDVPFERLVEALQPARDLQHTPLFQ